MSDAIVAVSVVLGISVYGFLATLVYVLIEERNNDDGAASLLAIVMPAGLGVVAALALIDWRNRNRIPKAKVIK